MTHHLAPMKPKLSWLRHVRLQKPAYQWRCAGCGCTLFMAARPERGQAWAYVLHPGHTATCDGVFIRGWRLLFDSMAAAQRWMADTPNYGCPALRDACFLQQEPFAS